MTLAGFYEWLQAPAQAGALVMFAHPGFHEYRKALEFDHFKLAPRVVPKLIGLEVIHWDGYTRGMKGYGGRFPYLDEALRQGWRVGAAASEDVHYQNWGTRDSTRLALLMTELSREQILDALRRRHFYATSNRHLQFAVNLARRDGAWAMMGDELHAADLPSGTAPLRVRYYDKDFTDWPERLEVVVNGQVVSSFTFPEPSPPAGLPFAGELTVPLPLARLPKKFYVYARLYGDAQESTFTESSPIFVDP
jgi:hypothetical protein